MIRGRKNNEIKKWKFSGRLSLAKADTFMLMMNSELTSTV